MFSVKTEFLCLYFKFCAYRVDVSFAQGRIQREAIGAIASLKPTKVTFFTMILYNSESTIRDIKSIWTPIVLSQQCCEIYFMYLTVANS